MSSASLGTCGEHLPAKVSDEGGESRSTTMLYVQVGLPDAANTESLIAHDLSVMGEKEKKKEKNSFLSFKWNTKHSREIYFRNTKKKKKESLQHFRKLIITRK